MAGLCPDPAPCLAPAPCLVPRAAVAGQPLEGRREPLIPVPGTAGEHREPPVYPPGVGTAGSPCCREHPACSLECSVR